MKEKVETPPKVDIDTEIFHLQTPLKDFLLALIPTTSKTTLKTAWS